MLWKDSSSLLLWLCLVQNVLMFLVSVLMCVGLLWQLLIRCSFGGQCSVLSVLVMVLSIELVEVVEYCGYSGSISSWCMFLCCSFLICWCIDGLLQCIVSLILIGLGWCVEIFVCSVCISVLLLVCSGEFCLVQMCVQVCVECLGWMCRIILCRISFYSQCGSLMMCGLLRNWVRYGCSFVVVGVFGVLRFISSMLVLVGWLWVYLARLVQLLFMGVDGGWKMVVQFVIGCIFGLIV